MFQKNTRNVALTLVLLHQHGEAVITAMTLKPHSVCKTIFRSFEHEGDKHWGKFFIYVF